MQVLKRYHRTMVKTLSEDIEKLEKILSKRTDYSHNKLRVTQSITLLQTELNNQKQRKLTALHGLSVNRLNRTKRRKQCKREKRLSATPNSGAPPINSKETVVNLSSVPLSTDEKLLLSRGLSFCPTPPSVNTFQLQCDLKTFYRRLRLREYFLDKEVVIDRDKEHNTFRLRNRRWNPPKNREPALETFIRAVDESVHTTSIKRVHDNLTRSERKALQSLKQRIAENEIEIKPSDKGSATVVMSYNDYVKEEKRQLSDTRFYQPLQKDPTSKLQMR